MKYRSIAIIVGISGMVALAQAPKPDVDDKQAEREEWFYGQRAYPLGRIPAGARLNAIAAISRLDRAARLRRQSNGLSGRLANALDSTTWTSIGPKPTDLGSTRVTAGRVNAIAIDPRDNNTVYIGAAEGGVWKTTDGGANWRPLTDDQPSLAMGALAIDPANPDTVYAGTGEENFALDSYYGAGILKSTDAGATWTNFVGPFLRDRISALAIHPSVSAVLLCSSQTGIWRSEDAGVSWTRVLTGVGTAVLFDPTDGNIAYAAIGAIAGNALNGVYRSTDAGLTFQLSPGSGANSLPRSNVGRINLTLAPSTPTTLYAAIESASANNLLGIFKTTDGAGTWNTTNAPDVCPSPVQQCWYDLTIRVHPKDPDIVFAAGSLVAIRTQNGGQTWSSLPFTGADRVAIHVDWHNLEFTPDGNKLFIANDGGVYSTTDITSNQIRWAQLNDTLALTQFYPGLSIHPTDPTIALGGAQDNGTQMFKGSPSWTNVTCGDGGYTAFDALLPTIAYAGCQFIQILRTANNGASWSLSEYGINQDDRVNFIPPLVMDPSNSETLYFGTYRVWQSRDGGGKWAPISPDITGRNTATIRAIGVAPNDGNTVYAGSTDIPRISTVLANTRIQVTNNARDVGGATWTNRSSGLPARVVTQITVDPIDPATAYATFSGFASSTETLGHVFKTTSGGARWLDISGDLPNIPVADLVVDPDIPDTLYIATDAGVMVTTDGGASWSSLGAGLPRVVVHALVLHRPSRTLRAATHGRSMWDIQVPLASAPMQPSIESLSPSTANAGGSDFTLAAAGSNFGAGTVLRWNGSNRPTTVVDTAHLTARISAADIAQAGRVGIDVFKNSRGGGASGAKLFTVGPAPVAVGASNSASGIGLSPRSIASLYGTNLAGLTVIADSAPPLPSFLGGVSMTVANNPVPFFFVSPGQINFQVPFVSITGPTQVPLTINSGLLNTTTTVTLIPYSPALFTTNQGGTGQAAALIAGTAAIVAPAEAFPGSRPAAIGDFVSLYGTGLGDVRNRPALGSPSPSNPLATTLVMPTVTVGGVNANVSFSGLAPGFVSEYQVNIQIPSGTPSGDAVPVILSIGGATSNTATIAVR